MTSVFFFSFLLFQFKLPLLFILFLFPARFVHNCPFSFKSNFPISRYIPSTALNTTAENVLNRSNKPNTVAGRSAVPAAPISMAARQMIAMRIQSYPGYARGENTAMAVYDIRLMIP